MIKKTIILLLLPVLIFLPCNCGFMESKSDVVPKQELIADLNVYNSEPESTQIDKYFNYLVTNWKFNGNILVAKKGKIIYKNSHGIADYKTKDSLTVDSRFQIASVSKQFTAVAVMMLFEQKKLSYEDTLQKFFPKFPYENITIRNLLTHRSGLPNYLYFCEDYTDRKTPITNKEVLKLMIKNKPAVYYKPDYRYHYCNTNYMLLPLIIEKVSGMDFISFMNKNIFEPLGMKNTYIYETDMPDTIKNITKGYHYSKCEALHVYTDGVTGDKGVYTTIDDLFIWDQALYTNILVKEETLKEAFKGGTKNKRGNRNYGFGWRIHEYGDKKYVFHGGWWRGYNSLFIRVIDTKNTFILLANKRTKCIANTYRHLVNILNPEIYTEKLDSLLAK